MPKLGRLFELSASALDQLALIGLALTGLGFAFDPVKPLAQIGAFSVTAVTALLLVITLLWLLALSMAAIQSKLEPGEAPARLALLIPPRLAGPVVAWLALLLASTLLAHDHKGDAVKLSLRLFGGIVIAWSVYNVARTQARWELVAKMIGLAGLGISLIGLGEAANLQGVRAWLENFRYGDTYFADVYRVSSTLTHPNTAAMALEVTLPLVLAWSLTTRHNLMRAALAVGLFAGLVALALTLSRGGAIAFLISLALTGVFALRHRDRAWVPAALAIGSGFILAVALTLVHNPSLVVRVISESGNDEWYRAGYQVPASLEARPGERLSVPVQVTNRGLMAWHIIGSNPFNISYHLVKLKTSPPAHGESTLSTNDDMITYSGMRTPLPAELPPYSSIKLAAQVVAPSNVGDYIIQWDMIEEGVTWFSRKGQAPAVTHLRVQGVPLAKASPPAAGPKEEVLNVDASRVRIWMAAWQVALHHPLLGVGPYNFRWYLQDYAVDGQAYHANSAYLEMLADTGLLGFVAFIWLGWELARATRQAGKSLRADETAFRIWWLAVTTSLLAWFIHGAVDFFYATSPFTGFALIAGLLLRLRDSPGWRPQNLL